MEIIAITRNLTYITDTVTVGETLSWFANQLVTREFLPHTTARGILGIPGIAPIKKAGQLMDSVFAKVRGSSDRKRHWFNQFVDIFSHDGAYSELCTQLKREIDEQH